MTRRTFLGASIGAAASRLSAARKPNIVLLFADDLGYGGTGPYGETEFATPNIDAIARGGVRFTNGYVSCPVCSPTRAGLMTGRYQQRFGHEFNPGPTPDESFGLSLDEKTIADRMKAAGYRTGMVGKWHLGYEPRFNPTRRGFDEFFGFPGGAHSFTDARGDRRNPILRGTEPVDEKEYLTDAFAREAVSFINRHKAGPFFLYLPFNAVHAPLQAPARLLERFPKIGDERRRTHAAMMTSMDDAIGRVLGALNENKLMGDTLIFFISDNGGPTPVTTSRNNPLRGFKGQAYEGGIRVPFLMRWDGTLPKGKTATEPVIALDVLPTAVAAAGGTADPAWKLDGVNLLPVAKGGSAPPHESLYWRFGQQRAIRKGDWKLVWPGTETPELYNLGADIGESKDLASAEPARLQALKTEWDNWSAQMMAPRWERGANRKGGKGKKKR
jgi:arylsulfatase A-like enzyme